MRVRTRSNSGKNAWSSRIAAQITDPGQFQEKGETGFSRELP
jgi:hypothetical protein